MQSSVIPVRTESAPAPLVELRGISKHFGEGETRVDALRDITLEVQPGKVIGLLGPSGSGKSTLLNVIGCIVEPSNGRMQLDGEAVYDDRWLRPDLRQLRLEKIGFIFQSHNLLPFLNSLENVAVVLDLARRNRKQANERAMELLDYLEVHRSCACQPPAHHSGRRAYRGPRLAARTHCDGPVTQGGQRTAGSHSGSHAR
jgi:putative ABC transport system ATP-binding protein